MGLGCGPDLSSGGGLHDGARAQAARADLHAAPCLADDDLDFLYVGIPDSLRDIVRVADLVPVHGSLAADLTRTSHSVVLLSGMGRPGPSVGSVDSTTAPPPRSNP